MNALRAATLCSLPLFTVFAATPEPALIDTAKSTMTVRVYKTGILSAFGHDHVISAPISAGTVDREAGRVDLTVNAADLQVRDPGASADDVAHIQKTMLGPEVLDTEHHPEIAFRSTAAHASENVWTVCGDLTLHGQTRPVTVQVRETNGRFTGSTRVRQSDFGMKPVKVAGGTVGVKDDVQIEFDIALR